MGSSGSGPDGRSFTYSKVLVSNTCILWSSLAQTITHLPSLARMMPRGRLPVLIVCTTASVSESMTEIVFSLFVRNEDFVGQRVRRAERQQRSGEGKCEASPLSCHEAAPWVSRLVVLHYLKAVHFVSGLIDAERVEFRELMQEARLRRDGHVDFGRHQQHRLAQLSVPGPVRKLLALERRELEFRRAHVGDQRLGIAGGFARRGFADRAHGHPDVVVEGTHGPAGEALEAVLELRAAPQLDRRMPRRREQSRPCRSRGARSRCDTGNSRRTVHLRPRRRPRRARVRPARSREFAAESVQSRHPSGGATGVVVELPLLDDLVPEALGRPPHGIRVGGVFLGRSNDQEPACATASRPCIGRARPPASSATAAYA